MRLTRRRFRVTAPETEWARDWVDAEFLERVEVIEARVAILDTERNGLEAELAERVQPLHEEEAGSHTVLRPLAVLSSALVVAAGFTGFAADAGGKPPGHFGVASGWKLPWLPAAEQARYLDSERAMGVQIVRFDVNWPSIQAGGPTSYNWVAVRRRRAGLEEPWHGCPRRDRVHPCLGASRRHERQARAHERLRLRQLLRGDGTSLRPARGAQLGSLERAEHLRLLPASP